MTQKSALSLTVRERVMVSERAVSERALFWV